MGRHAASPDEIGIDKQARITNACWELCEAVKGIHPERRVEFLAYVYRILTAVWREEDESQNSVG